jgi:hypothetical protein
MKSVEVDRPVMVPIDEIDDGLRPARQMRLALDEEAIEQYAEHLADLPPVRLMWDEQENVYWVVDGAHSITAAAQLEDRRVRAVVEEGGYLEAFFAAARSNRAHGVRLTNADKRHRVEVALDDPALGGQSTRDVAHLCSVSQSLVARVKSEREARGAAHTVGAPEYETHLNPSNQSATVEGKDGKVYPARKPRGPAPAPAPARDKAAAAPEYDLDAEIDAVQTLVEGYFHQCPHRLRGRFATEIIDIGRRLEDLALQTAPP